jgi:hypothetical protein
MQPVVTHIHYYTPFSFASIFQMIPVTIQITNITTYISISDGTILGGEEKIFEQWLLSFQYC